jgi:predicted metal-dependent hydrolase
VSTKPPSVEASGTADLPAEADVRYSGYFRCFNQQLYFEAHSELEPLWLAQRSHANSAFYKALIQLAGAFVHVKKGRSAPAARLLKLAQVNLEPYPATHQGLDLIGVRGLIDVWLNELNPASSNPAAIEGMPPPVLHLVTS